MAKSESERHPFRFLIKFLIFVGILVAASKLLASKKDEYMGMTESEARSKFTKLGPKIGEDKAAEIAEKVIPKLKEAGVIKDDPVDDVVDLVEEAAEEVLEEVSD